MILVCGEALVDLFLEPAEGAALPARAVAGGSPFNLAIGLARLGQPVSFFGGLSKDHFGEHLTGLLRKEGVGLDHAKRLERLSTISVIATDAHGSPAYAFHGEGAADRMITEADLPPALPGVAAIAFGSYSIAVEPCGSAFLALARREKGRRIISIDPNVRPTIIGDIGAWKERFAAFLATADIVKASEEDIALGYGASADPVAVARSWLAAGPRLIIVTRGSRGAIAVTADGVLDRPARAVTVVDTVGAGDTFHAAFLARLSELGALKPDGLIGLSGPALATALDHAIAAAAITCTRRGADMPRRAELDRFIETGTP